MAKCSVIRLWGTRCECPVHKVTFDKTPDWLVKEFSVPELCPVGEAEQDMRIASAIKVGELVKQLEICASNCGEECKKCPC